ncbi:hypothetical protein TWF694_011770 [Orbilia ellipsospora]|uniref:Allergen n=1 Tax=Orbilia ellipsospora TaxID=2528407 RepID=A0AAV9X666_9PEZI
MQAAKQAVSEFLHHGNKHSVDIEQETKPAVLHETVHEQQHENVIHAIDREVHQHHHQIHVQPIHHKVVEDEKHHHKIIPIEHRHKHHGKDHKFETALAAEHGQFKDEQNILPVQNTNQHNVVVGEHIHHHVHDYIQPVIERERIVPHVVHTTVPIHEHIEHEPYIHKGNVLPTMTMEEFTKKGFSLKGSKKPLEHIDYEGNPLEIDGQSHVGFGKSATASEMYDPMSGRQREGMSREPDMHTGPTGNEHGQVPAGDMNAPVAGATGGAAAKAYTHGTKPKSKRHGSGSSSEEDKGGRIPRSFSGRSGGKKSGTSPRKHSWLDKLNPRVETPSEIV